MTEVSKFEKYLSEQVVDSEINYSNAINKAESESVISTFYGQTVAYRDALNELRKIRNNEIDKMGEDYGEK